MKSKLFKKLMLEGYGLKYPIYALGSKVVISKGIYNDWIFGIEGLNLTKEEREIFGGKRFEFSGILTIRLGRMIFTYYEDGYLKHFDNMKISNIN